jgi:hypothetical protein
VKTEGQIKQKLKQVIYRHRKNYVERGLEQRPENCSYNEPVRLPLHTANRAVIRVCGYCPDGSNRNAVVCDSSMAGDRQAAECPYFHHRKSGEDLKDEFKSKLGLDGSTVNIGLIAKEYPDVAALMWALGPGKNVDRKAPSDSKGPGILAFFGENIEEPDVVPERPLVEDGDER